MRPSKNKYMLVTLVIVICTTVVFFQYESQNRRHERLMIYGKTVAISTNYYTSLGVDYARFTFLTDDGRTIEGARKCGSMCAQYENARVIYNPADPEEYDLDFEFKKYHPTWKIIFFFLIYLPVMVFVTYRMIKLIVFLYNRLKR